MPALRLRAVSGPRRGQEFVFSGPRVRIGRSRDNDLILPEHDAPLASSHHAEALLASSGAWSIVDIGSANGTRLNDVAITRQPLKSGDVVSFGDEQFAVTIGHPSRLRPALIAALVGVAVTIAAAIVVDRSRNRPTFEDIAGAAARSVFMIAIEADGSRSVVGTGFVVDADGVLATNAHIAAALQRRGALSLRTDGPRAVAVQGDTYDARPIASVAIHPGWRGTLDDDAALLHLRRGSRLTPLKLASAESIAAVRRGSPVAAFGFPFVSTDPARPRGRLSVDVVGDVRGNYLEVGLGIAPGTSGSPVFDRRGAVVAIVAGGDFVTGPNGIHGPSGSSANWALSAEVIRQLLAR